jgi:GntR family transcriptional repressor for pyruvate dehydrogenase complex
MNRTDSTHSADVLAAAASSPVQETASGDGVDELGTAAARATLGRASIGRAVKTSERVATAIVSEIVSGGFRAGDRLPNEATMLERFQVGRASLREALRILEVHGLISLRSGPGGGPVVTAVDPRDVARTFSLYLNLSGARIRELVEARLFLEPMVARMAAEAADPAGLKRLERALEYEASVPADDGNYIDAANNFHFAVVSMSGNKVVDLLATALKELYTTRTVAGGLASRTTEPTIRREHREIGQAILAGDADTAERLMREHTNLYLGRVLDASPGFAESVITWD